MCMKENLIHYRTSVCNINYHMVWSVKYRRKILNADIEAYLKKLVQQFLEIRSKLWKGELWNHSYYCETIGSVSEENIKRYIEHQSKSY
jgi:putative transposase